MGSCDARAAPAGCRADEQQSGGDIAEAIVHAYYGGERGGFSQPGWDVKTPDGERIQVKAMRTTATTKRRNVSPIRDIDYDSVVIVIFDEDFQVLEGLKVSREVVEELFVVRPYLNGRVILVSQKLRDDPRVEFAGSRTRRLASSRLATAGPAQRYANAERDRSEGTRSNADIIGSSRVFEWPSLGENEIDEHAVMPGASASTVIGLKVWTTGTDAPCMSVAPPRIPAAWCRRDPSASCVA